MQDLSVSVSVFYGPLLIHDRVPRRFQSNQAPRSCRSLLVGDTFAFVDSDRAEQFRICFLQYSRMCVARVAMYG